MHLFVGGWNLCICTNSSFFNAIYFPFRFNAVLKFTTVGGCKASFFLNGKHRKMHFAAYPRHRGPGFTSHILNVNSDTALCSGPGYMFLFL